MTRPGDHSDRPDPAGPASTAGPAATTPLHTLDPSASDPHDLEVLRELVGDARVVCLGESAHAVSEFCALKDRLFRYLVTELGFTALVMESGFAEGRAVDRWVHGGPGEIGEPPRTGITYGFGDNDPMRAQLEWMRRRTETGRPVSFYGMDVPGASVDPGAAVAECLSRLTPLPGDADLATRARLGDRYTTPLRWAAMSERDRDLLATGIDILCERAGNDDEIATLWATGARLVIDSLTGGMSLGPGHNPRDEHMARTVEWVLEQEERVVISAHNAHVQRSPLFGAPSIGTLLAPVLGRDMVVIGTTRAAGTIPELHGGQDPLVPASATEDPMPPPGAHTWDALLDGLGRQHLTVLDRLPADARDAATAIGMQAGEMAVDRRAFDALAHIREIHPLPGTVRAMQNSIRSRL